MVGKLLYSRIFLLIQITYRQDIEILGQTHRNDSKTCVKWPLSKRRKIEFQDQLSLNAGQKYCRMLQREHSAILFTFIKLPFVIKIFVLSIFERLFYTGFTVCHLEVPIKAYFDVTITSCCTD